MTIHSKLIIHQRQRKAAEKQPETAAGGGRKRCKKLVKCESEHKGTLLELEIKNGSEDKTD